MPKQKPGKSKQDYGTPDDFLAAALDLLEIETFDMDLACRKDNQIQPSRRGMHFPKHDSLVERWPMCYAGLWHFLNPEFRLISKFVAKCWRFAKQGGRVAVLVPAGVGSNWYAEHVNGKAFVYFLNGRLIFKGTPINPRTGKPDAYPKDCMLILYGLRDADGKLITGNDVWRWK